MDYAILIASISIGESIRMKRVNAEMIFILESVFWKFAFMMLYISNDYVEFDA